MSNFLLLLHQSPTNFDHLAPEEIQKILGKYIAWREDMIRHKQLRGGDKLTGDGGRLIKIKDGSISVTDGPFSEASEVLGGYFMIEAADYDEAVEIARTCPHLDYSGWIEVRQIEEVH